MDRAVTELPSSWLSPEARRGTSSVLPCSSSSRGFRASTRPGAIQLAKYVVSTTMTDPAWQNSTLLNGDPVVAVRALKEQAGEEISLTGSITLCHTLIAAGLVDEYRLWTYPYVQGRGRRLFPDGHRHRLVLAEHRAFSSGVTYARWVPQKG
ncbi:MAG: dihydrofolate reductase family protein [Brachybacterium tyrofermentans]